MEYLPSCDQDCSKLHILHCCEERISRICYIVTLFLVNARKFSESCRETSVEGKAVPVPFFLLVNIVITLSWGDCSAFNNVPARIVLIISWTIESYIMVTNFILFIWGSNELFIGIAYRRQYFECWFFKAILTGGSDSVDYTLTLHLIIWD